jgi:hypothetical protein
MKPCCGSKLVAGDKTMNNLWVFFGQVASLSLPILIAGITLILSMKFNLLAALNKPIDAGSNIFGANKTWRGGLIYLVVATLFTVLLHIWDLSWLHPIYRDNPWLLGAAMSCAYVFGELVNSFVKRRIGISPGQTVGLTQKVFDTIDGMLAAGVVLLVVYAVEPSFLFASLVFSILLHLSTDALMRRIGLKQKQ